MDESVKRRLGDVNREFYRTFAQSFAETRSEPQPGFYLLEEFLPQRCRRLLDVGCGEGRLGRFLLSRGSIEQYDGIDASEQLLSIASDILDARFWQRDLTAPDALRDLGMYEGIACLAVLQHIPGRDERQRLVTEMANHLASGGTLLISTWQFLSSERQRRKIIDWDEVDLTDDMVEENDYLLTWRRGGLGLRYVRYIDESEIVALGEQAGLKKVATVRADGREGDLNLYAVFEPGQRPTLVDIDQRPMLKSIALALREQQKLSAVMNLKETLQADVKTAMREGDTLTRDTLRMLLAAIKQEEVDGRQELDDAGCLKVLTKQAKQRKESIADAQRAGRDDLAKQEEAELAIIETYLPQMLSRAEIEAEAMEVIQELDAGGMQDMGRVMGQLMPRLQGQADGKLTSQVVRELLQAQ